MLRKQIIKSIVYSALFLLLNLAEKSLGIFGFSAGFLFALIFCRERFYIVLPIYFGSALAINFSIMYLICASCTVCVALTASLVHLKTKIKHTLTESSLLTLVSMVPYIVFNTSNVYAISMTIIGCLSAVVFQYISVTALYPICVRGMRYRFTFNEYLSGAILICVLSIGLFAVNIVVFRLFYFVAPLLLLVARGFGTDKVMLLGATLGSGASIASGDPADICYCVLMAVVCVVFSKTNVYLTSVCTVLVFFLARYFFNGTIGVFEILPVALGALASMVLPRNFQRIIKAYRESYQERFALRTVVNRDRAEVSKRLKNVAAAFSEMQNILVEEKPDDGGAEGIVRNVCELCESCIRQTKCRDKMGDAYPSVKKLVAAALDNGRSTILDASVSLGENCNKLAQMITLTNDYVKQYRKMQERRSGIEQGKEMVISQMGGVAQLLTSLSQSINTGMTFDTAVEKRLIEELGYANIVATDAVVYNDEEGICDVTLVVREIDADKPHLITVLSLALGAEMCEVTRQREVKGMVSVYYTLSPRYRVAFGESVVAKDGRSGDTRQAIKIGQNKLMFILSDGMGTGQSAFNTSSHIIMLIETFYKAGFDHRTIFSCVSRLLALRKKEDFSALDVVIIDTQNGFVDFIKQGGRESYVISGNDFSVIVGESLPLGILDESEPMIERRKLKNNDLLIMISDGVADVMGLDDFKTLLTGNTAHNPQLIADSITANSIHLSGQSKDDMTAMVVRFVDKSA